jgi:hypothetical protein
MLALRQQERAAHQRFLDLLSSQALDQQTKQEMADSVAEALRCLEEMMGLLVKFTGPVVADLATKDEMHRKGPRIKQERVRQRNEIIRKLIDIDITEPVAIFRHLQEHYPDLVRKGRKGWISPEQMMRAYRSDKKP